MAGRLFPVAANVGRSTPATEAAAAAATASRRFAAAALPLPRASLSGRGPRACGRRHGANGGGDGGQVGSGNEILTCIGKAICQKHHNGLENSIPKFPADASGSWEMIILFCQIWK